MKGEMPAAEGEALRKVLELKRRRRIKRNYQLLLKVSRRRPHASPPWPMLKAYASANSSRRLSTRTSARRGGRRDGTSVPAT